MYTRGASVRLYEGSCCTKSLFPTDYVSTDYVFPDYVLTNYVTWLCIDKCVRVLIPCFLIYMITTITSVLYILVYLLLVTYNNTQVTHFTSIDMPCASMPTIQLPSAAF